MCVRRDSMGPGKLITIYDVDVWLAFLETLSTGYYKVMGIWASWKGVYLYI